MGLIETLRKAHAPGLEQRNHNGSIRGEWLGDLAFPAFMDAVRAMGEHRSATSTLGNKASRVIDYTAAATSFVLEFAAKVLPAKFNAEAGLFFGAAMGMAIPQAIGTAIPEIGLPVVAFTQVIGVPVGALTGAALGLLGGVYLSSVAERVVGRAIAAATRPVFNAIGRRKS